MSLSNFKSLTIENKKFQTVIYYSTTILTSCSKGASNNSLLNSIAI